MLAIARKVENEKELGRLVSIEDGIARDRGHAVSWEYDEDGDDLLAKGTCPGCGLIVAARIFSDGRAWSAGRLRLARECRPVDDHGQPLDFS